MQRVSHGIAGILRRLGRRRWRVATALAGTAGAVLMTVGLAPPAQAQAPTAADCLTAEYAATSWNTGPDSGGFVAGITIANTCEEAVQGWTVALGLPPEHEFVTGWAAVWSTTNGVLTGAATKWNGDIGPDGSTIIGFIGSFTGGYQDPLTCTVNGAVCEGYEPDPGENQPPVVVLTSPVDGDTFNYPCNATLTADASDPDGEIDRVEFYVDGLLFAVDDTAPYEAELSFGMLETVVFARAYDDGDPKLSTDSESVTVFFSPPPPAPPPPPPGPEAASEAAQTSDAPPILSCVDSLEVEEGGSLVVTHVNVCGAPPGDQTITMVVDGDPAITVDPMTFPIQGAENVTISAAPGSAGATATVSAQGGCSPASALVTVVPATGSPVNQPPEVTLTEPADGAAVLHPCTTTLRADAHDPDGEIDRVEFYLNDELVGTVDTAPYELVVSSGPPAQYNNVVFARAYDDGDPQLSADSDPVSYSVMVPPPGPVMVVCDTSVEVPEGGTETVMIHNFCLSTISLDADVDGDPGITVSPESFEMDQEYSSQELTISAAPGTAGASGTVTLTGGCGSPSIAVTVVPARD